MFIYDKETFETVNVNSCYVCVDGCDTWITVKNGKDSHMIRFGYGSDEEKIAPVKAFIDKLNAIKEGITIN